MEKKVVLYEKFISLLKEEWRSIAEYSIDSLEPIVFKKDELVHQLQVLESDRTQTMKKVAKGLQISYSNLTMKNLLNVQKSPLNSRLANSRKKLLGKIQIVNEWNRSIRRLEIMIKNMIKRNKRFYNFLLCCKINIANAVRNVRIFMDSSLAPIDELTGGLQRIVYYRNFMKSKGVEIAILCDTVESKHIIEQGMNWKLIPIDILVICKDIDPPLRSKNYMQYTSDWTKQVQSIVVPRIFFNDDHALYEIYSDLKMRGDKVMDTFLGGFDKDKLLVGNTLGFSKE